MTASHRRPVACLALLACVAACGRPAPNPMTIDGLGTLTFPVSTTSAAAESAFVRGVLLLHAFEYPTAAESFREAQRLDSTLAIALWGEAMTFNHPVWNEQDSVAARSLLNRLGASTEAREARRGTDVERGLLHAVSVLYGDGSKAQRDSLYATEMGALLHRHPEDDEVRSFYSLALLGLSQGVRDVPTYVQAAAIAESVFVRNPHHPGAVHYWIHGMDDPEHAAGALEAARALADIAPDAGHAQHMTSHIFMALGMWNDVLDANVHATATTNHHLAAAGRPSTSCGHYNLWLEYGALQLGQRDSARTIVEGCIRQALPNDSMGSTDPDNSALGSAIAMWARYLIDTEEWSDTLAHWTPSLASDDPMRATWLFARGTAAARRGDRTAASNALAEYEDLRRQLVARFDSSTDPGDAEFLKRVAALELELRAEVLLAAQPARTDSAVALLRAAAAIEDAMAYAFGPPDIVKPTHERLGELLLSAGRAEEARWEFEAALRRTPNRMMSVDGLKRAEQSAKAGGTSN